MELYSAVNPMILSSVARLLPEDPNYTLNTVLPDRQIPQIEFAIDQLKVQNRAAKFRAFDAPVEIGINPTFIRQTGELPAVGIGYVMGEYRRLLEQQLTMPGATLDPIINQYAHEYVKRGERAIQARMELARGQLLATGKVTITAEGGMTGLEADFGVPSANKVTASPLWSDTTNANPIADLQTWMQLMQGLYGTWPNRMMMGKTASINFLNNQKIRNQLGSFYGGPVVAVSPQRANPMLAEMSLPELATTPDGRAVRPTRVDLDGTTTDTFPANLVTLYTEGATGETLWGPTFESLEFVSDGIMQATDAPGITAWVEKDGNPGQLFTVVNAISLPVLTQPWNLLIATVG